MCGKGYYLRDIPLMRCQLIGTLEEVFQAIEALGFTFVYSKVTTAQLLFHKRVAPLEYGNDHDMQYLMGMTEEEDEIWIDWYEAY